MPLRPVGTLFLALVLHHRVRGQEGPERADRWRFFFLAFALGLLRPPYQLIGLVIFSLPATWLRGRQAQRFFAVFFGILLITGLAWSLIIPHLFTQMRTDVVIAPMSQLHLILTNPGDFARVLWRESWAKAPAHFAELMGYFGWRHLPLPAWLAAATGLGLILSLFTLDLRVLRWTWPLRVLVLALSLVAILGVITEIYVSWNALGATEVVGLHARYFLTFVPFVSLGLGRQTALGDKRWIPGVLFGGLTLVNVLALGLLAHASYP